MGKQFITNKGKFLSEIIESILPKCDNAYFLVGYFYFSGFAELYTKLKDTRAEVAELQKIRRCVDIALRADQPEQMQSRTKRHDIAR